MAADIISENLPLSQKVAIKGEILREEPNSIFKTGETFVLKDLLSAALVESNNSAIMAIAQTIGESAFVDLMNLEAKFLGMTKTSFSNSTGLDPKDREKDLINLSTAWDLTKLMKHLLKNPLILEIIGQKEFALYTAEGNFHHLAVTTNEFLKSGISFEDKEIIGGKTGQTERAGGCLVLILRVPGENGFLINIVLGSDDRFGDMERIIGWVSKTYEL
jgi:D-alanyl-D-alanine carboxypeptidase